MEEKPYGKFSLDQLKQLTEILDESSNTATAFEEAFNKAGSKRIKSKLGEDFSWSHYYEMPFHSHITCAVFILNWKDDLDTAAKSEDPQQYFLNFLQQLDPEQEWTGGYKGYFDTHHLVEIIVSIIRTVKSIMVYRKSLSTLIEEAVSGSDKALFDAIRIDRSIVNCEVAKHRISYAEMTGDKKFFQHLNKAIKGPDRKHWVSLEHMKFMMYVLVEAGVDKAKNKDLEDLFVEHLKLYPKTPGAQKNLHEQFLKTRNVYHRK